MNPIKLFGKTKLLWSLPGYGRLLVRLYRDVRVPGWLKFAGLAAAALIVSPLDPFADIPFLNVLDDAALLMLAANIFLQVAPAAIVAEHRAAVGLDRGPGYMKNVTPRSG